MRPHAAHVRLACFTQISCSSLTSASQVSHDAVCPVLAINLQRRCSTKWSPQGRRRCTEHLRMPHDGDDQNTTNTLFFLHAHPRTAPKSGTVYLCPSLEYLDSVSAEEESDDSNLCTTHVD